MAHLSRPQQIALAAILVLVLGLLALSRLHKGSSESTGSGSSSSAPSTSAAQPSSSGSQASSKPGLGQAEEKAAAAPSPVYHGPVPGLEGLTRDIARAHGAVATSQEYDKHVEEKAPQVGSQGESSSQPGSASAPPASSSSAPGTSSSASSAHNVPAAKAVQSVAHTPSRRAAASAHAPAPHRGAAVPAKSASGPLPRGQQAVEKALAEGKVPLLLFWNPAGADDIAVHRQVQQLGSTRLKIAVYVGKANDVAAYGAITRAVPVYGTPTILIVAKDGKTIELTGLQEDFAIEQAIAEARGS